MSEPVGFTSTPTPRYATFTRRFRAVVIDNAIVSGAAVVMFFLGAAASELPGATRLMLLLVVALLLLYEPVFVSRRGATIGHAMSRIQVVDARTGRWPSFGRAFARLLIKMIVGIPSFITMALSRRHQAVHDLLTQTTVQVSATEDAVEFHEERIAEPDVLLPSRFRRLAVVLVYLVAVYFVFAISIAFVPRGCSRGEMCSVATRVLLQAIAWSWLMLSAAVIIAGWRGLLIGARRTRQVASEMVVA